MLSASKPVTTLFNLAAVGILCIILQNLILQKWTFSLTLYTPSNLGTVKEPFECKPPQYISRVVSYDPLIIHVDNFILPEEREHLIKRGKSLLKRSLVAGPEGGAPTISEKRTSSSAFIPWNDEVATCLQERAAEFQGFVPRKKIEMLQVVQYQQSQEYRAHYDWGVNWVQKAQRHTTFFGILDANCTHCGTQFPDISIDWTQEDPKWCAFVDCEDRDMLTFRAVEGSAVFWKNLHEDGRGDVRTLHAGLPVENGTKTGLNIWTIV